jgi:hypothetical protein
MPWETIYVEPDVVLKYCGVMVYHMYKHDDINQGARTYEFTLSADCAEDDCRCQAKRCKSLFDVRELPNWTEPPHPPLFAGENNIAANQAAWTQYRANRTEEKHIKRVLREAIRRMFLVPGRGIVKRPRAKRRRRT